MSNFWAWLATMAIVFFVNLMPAFVPPTWAVLAVVHASTDIPLLVLTVPGPAASAAGRVVLAWESRSLRRFVPPSDRANADALADWVNAHPRWRFVSVFLYCLGPFPSNPLFIAAGIGRIPLPGVVLAFYLSRVIADTFWVWTAGVAVRNIASLFVDALTSWQGLTVQVLALLLVVVVLRLPWARWIGGARRPSGGV